MPVVRHGLAGQDGDRGRAKVVIDRFHQPEGINVLRHLDMSAHSKRVNACVSSAGSMQGYGLARRCVHSLFHRLLDRRPMGLTLQAEERCAIKLEGEGEAGQASVVPAAIAQPRNRSAVAITGRPARWTKVGRIAPVAQAMVS